MSGADGKEDKYEQLLAKIDWRSPYPPKGYQYGAGRGAKGFITTAELSMAGVAGTKITREENDFFAAMERLEDRKKGKNNKADGDEADLDEPGKAKKSSTPSKTIKLSMDDLATLELPPAAPAAKSPGQTASATVDATASPAASAAAPLTASLVVRSARTEEGDAAEEHVFADERGLTASDVLRGKASAVQAGLQNVLAMGSSEEQTTWITHARAYREMGMMKRAWQTLIEGCAVTGKKGKRIWEERLRYLAKDNLAGRRRLLEEATVACPTEEELWVQLLDVVPPLERVPCLQRAVLACPSSEHLWLRLVQFVPSAQDQRVLLQRALQHTPHLPLLWARLARLESYKTGKEMFQAAAARYPSLSLIIEAAKYVEWYALSHWAVGPLGVEKAGLLGNSGLRPDAVKTNEEEERRGCGGSSPMQGRAAQLYNALREADREVGDLVRTAQVNYLKLSEAGSRRTWLSLALSLLHSGDTDSSSLGAAAENEEVEAAGQSMKSAAKTSAYVCTAAHMFLCVVDPSHKGLSASGVPVTWLNDLVSLFTTETTMRYEVRCALWYTWVLLQQQCLSDVVRQTSTNEVSSSPSYSTVTHSKEAFATLEAAFLSAPSTSVQSEVPWLLQQVSPDGATDKEIGSRPASVAATPATATAPANMQEEEELAKPRTPLVAVKATSSAPSTAAGVPSFPSPLVIIVAATLGLTSHTAAMIRSSSSEVLSDTLKLLVIEVPLALSEALYRRGCYAAALAVVDFVLPLNSSACPSDAVLSEDAPLPLPNTASSTEPQASASVSLYDQRLHVARAKYLAAVGDDAAADHCLLEAINAAASRHSGSTALQEESWVKLSVLRRSLGQPIESILKDAVRQCPRSWRLWLMLMEEKRRAIDAHQRSLTASLSAARNSGTTIATHRLSTAELLRMDDTHATEVREVRQLYKTALGADHCRTVAAVWIFAAQRIEAELLQNVPAASALLTDAATACAAGVYSTRSQLLARALSPQEVERQASALAQLGVAQARLEAQYGTPGQALETVQEVLQKLPKTRDGPFAVAQDDAVGELLGLFIALEPPASRGRAAAQVMRQWKSREPLALCAVAQLYYTAGQYARALDQAVKAVEASKGSCGDAIGLLWRMADQPVMHAVVRKQLSGSKASAGDKGVGEDDVTAAVAGAESTELTPEAVQQWVMSVVASSAAGVAPEERRTAPTTAPVSVVPRSGPLWIAVAKVKDPTNITIRGYRRPVMEMLREVANLVELSGPASAAAAPLRL